MADAGLQAAGRVAAASDPLSLLTEISQNFLSLVSSLTNQKVGRADQPMMLVTILSGTLVTLLSAGKFSVLYFG